MKTKLLLAASAAFSIGTAVAGTITTNAVAPTVDGLDIANVAAPTGGESLWSDRAVQGQTFMTGPSGGRSMR